MSQADWACELQRFAAAELNCQQQLSHYWSMFSDPILASISLC